ncbi:MAG: thiamine-phosphate kinase [Actinomycetota bacterium]
MTAQKVSELGEVGLVRRIIERIGESKEGETWSGDDTAVIFPPGPRLLMTTDFVVEGVDFTLDTFPPDAIGWKAFAVNVSDIAAMGGIPEHSLVSMALRPDMEVATVDAILEGMLAAAEKWGVSLVGGDLSQADEIMVSIALLGSLVVEGAVLRSGAKVGDAICVTGSLGGAAAGLEELRAGAKGEPTDAMRRQMYPEPRLQAGQVIAEAGATAMIDLSDGLAVDLSHLVHASSIGCQIDPDALPLHEALAAKPREQALDMAITGGEDFELLFTIRERDIREVRESLGDEGPAITQIGVVTDGAEMIGDKPLKEWEKHGWDHLRTH